MAAFPVGLSALRAVKYPLLAGIRGCRRTWYRAFLKGGIAAFAAGERRVKPVQVELGGELPDVVRCRHGKHVPVLSAFLRHMSIVTRYSQPLSQAPQHFITDETGRVQWAQYAAVYFRVVFPHVESRLGAALRGDSQAHPL